MKTDQPRSKRLRFASGTRASEQIAQSLAKPADEEGGYEPIPLDRIDPDPQNPRKLGLSPTNPREIDDNDPLLEKKQASLQSLEDMAFSIRATGVITPIRVYRAGSRFRIAHGERRFLASLLAEKSTIPAIILKERPKSLRLEQYIENAARLDLTLAERLQNLQRILEESEALDEPLKTGDALREKIGQSRTQAFRYWAVLNAPKDVWEAVQKEQITSLDDAAQIAAIADPILRNRAIKEGVGTPAPVPKAAVQRGRGRPQVIRLGTTPRVDVVQRIVEAIAGQGKYEIDWTDPAAVTRAFKTFLKSMEDGKL